MFVLNFSFVQLVEQVCFIKYIDKFSPFIFFHSFSIFFSIQFNFFHILFSLIFILVIVLIILWLLLCVYHINLHELYREYLNASKPEHNTSELC